MASSRCDRSDVPICARGDGDRVSGAISYGEWGVYQELSPAAFRLIPVEHSVAEAVLVRVSDLRKLPQQALVRRLLPWADQIMDETDTLHVSLKFEVVVDEEDIEV